MKSRKNCFVFSLLFDSFLERKIIANVEVKLKKQNNSQIALWIYTGINP